MSLKLCCALPGALNCLKSARLLIVKPQNFKTSLCATTQQNRWLSSTSEEPPKTIYYGPLTAHVRAVKVFSLTSSMVGLAIQPVLYKEILSTGNIPIILAAYSFIGFFTLLTPVLLHLITKKYIIELQFDEETSTYTAKSFNFFCMIKETKFKVEDVFVPDVPGMFETFKIKGKPLFVDPSSFDHPEYYANLMGYDKPMDFKLYEKPPKDPK